MATQLTLVIKQLTIALMFEVKYAESVQEDLDGLRARERSIILDRIEEQLRHQPDRETRNKKIVAGLKPPWEHEEPVWELRVGKYRIFYDIDVLGQRVIVRAIREKPPHMTTEEIL